MFVSTIMWLLKPFTRKQKTLTSIQMLGCDNHKPILGTEDQWGSRFFVWKLSCKFMAAPVSPNNFLSAKIFFQVNFTALMLVNMVMIQVTITRIFCWSSWLPLSKIHSKHLLNNYLRKGKVIPWLCLGNAAMLRKTFCNDFSCNCKGSFRDEFHVWKPVLPVCNNFFF